VSPHWFELDGRMITRSFFLLFFSFVYMVWASKGYRSTSPSYALLLPLAFVVAVAEFYACTCGTGS